jgi:hypothetical protein
MPLYLFLLLLILAVIGGCGESYTHFATSADRPRISEFRIRALTAEVSGQTIRWRISVRITDRNNDLVGGEAEITPLVVNHNVSLAGPDLRLTIEETAPGAATRPEDIRGGLVHG